MKTCEHDVEIPKTSRATKRAPDCLLCHADYLADHAKRSAEQRATMTDEERQAFLEYQRVYSKKHRAEAYARHWLWRAERRLIEALDAKVDETEIQKLRYKLAVANELIHVFRAW